MYITLLLLVFIYLIWRYSTRNSDYWKKRDIKYKKPLPIFGNVASFVLQKTSFHQCLNEVYNYFESERYGGFFFMRDPTLMVRDPNLLASIMITDFQHFTDHGFPFFNTKNRKLNPLSQHLFAMEGTRWKVLRQKMNPVFTSSKLKSMHSQIVSCVDALNQYIETDMKADSKQDNVKDLYERLTIDVIGSCAFGIECNSSKNSNSKYREIGVKVFKPSVAHVLRNLVRGIDERFMDLLKIPDVPSDIAEFFVNVVYETINFRRQNSVNRNDFLQLLMSLKNTTEDPSNVDERVYSETLVEEKFSEVDIAANAFVFFTAGFETTASTISFCLYELALNPDIQNKLRNEIQDTSSKYEKLDADTLKELSYMDMVISETLRKYPPVTVNFRKCTKTYRIPNSNHVIEPGTKLMIPVWQIQRDPKYFPNPDEFDPERFNPDNKHKITAGMYMPFGDGPRICIGKRFALLEIKTAIADALLKYDFSPCAKTEIPLTYKKGSGLLTTNQGVWLNISRRKLAD